jgi:hypothetical protein
MEIENRINSLIYMETFLEDEYILDYPYFKPSKGMIKCYIIYPNILKSLNQYTNIEIELSFINVRNNILTNSLFSKIIEIVCHDDNLIYLDYLKNRGIKLNNKLLLDNIYYILHNGNKFYLIKYLIEYGISISNTEILFMYVTNIHFLLIESQQSIYNELFLEWSMKKDMHINNIKFLIDKGIDINYRNETEYYLWYSIKEMLQEIEYTNDVCWVIRKDFLIFIENMYIYFYIENNIENHICKYLGNDLLMREILSYI